jgi:hypothetical protein
MKAEPIRPNFPRPFICPYMRNAYVGELVIRVLATRHGIYLFSNLFLFLLSLL